MRSKSQLSWRDVITLSISIAAFCLSLITTYYNFLRETDDIKVWFEPFDMFVYEGKLLFGPTLDFTFVNSGNRSASIELATVTFHRISGSDCIYPSTNLQYEFEPFVIPPNQVTVRKFKIKEDVNFQEDQEWKSFGQYLVSKSEKPDGPSWSLMAFLAIQQIVEEKNAAVCLGFIVTTPTERIFKRRLIAVYRFYADGPRNKKREEYVGRTKPFIVHQSFSWALLRP